LIDDPLIVFWLQVHIAGLKTTSTVSALGKKIRIGNEDRVITHVGMSLFMVGENEEGKPTYTEITDDMVAKAKALRDKNGVPEPPCADGKVHLYGRYTLSQPLTRENSACEKDKIRDRVNSSQAADYVVECNLSQEQIASLQKATQTSLGVSPGGVSLAQTYGNLFEHRFDFPPPQDIVQRRQSIHWSRVCFPFLSLSLSLSLSISPSLPLHLSLSLSPRDSSFPRMNQGGDEMNPKLGEMNLILGI
jgi:hypothetical protein